MMADGVELSGARKTNDMNKCGAVFTTGSCAEGKTYDERGTLSFDWL